MAAKPNAKNFLKCMPIEKLKNFKCAQCSSKFGETSSLKAQINSTPKKNYWCDICDYFKIQKHLNLSLEFKELRCNICGKAFSRKSVLVRHVNRIHKDIYYTYYTTKAEATAIAFKLSLDVP
jgi:uncharacterized Zn-finger protein